MTPIKKTFHCDYNILPSQHLIIEYYKGVGTSGCVENMKEVEIRDDKYSKDYNILADFREVLFDMTLNEVKSFVDYLIKGDKFQSNQSKTALLISSLNQNVYLSFYSKHKEFFMHDIRLFKTLEDACEWMDLDPLLVWEELNEVKLSPSIKWEMESSF